MIAHVMLTIHTDDGVPVVEAGRRQLAIQVPGDFEGNLHRAASLLAELNEDAMKGAQGQVRDYREMEGGGRPFRPPERS